MTRSRHDIEARLLENLIPKYDQDIAHKSITDSRSRRDDMEIYSPSYDDRHIQIKSIRSVACFRIRFRLPVSIYMPKATQALSGIHSYYRDPNGKSFPTGFVAAYVPNLNHFTMVRLSGDRIGEYFPDPSGLLHRDVCKKFVTEKGTEMEFSSLNFLLINKTTAYNLTSTEIKTISKCFEYSFWDLPTPNMQDDLTVTNNIIYHSYVKIRSIYKTFKTIVKIDRLHTARRSMRLLTRDFCYVEADTTILVDNGEILISRPCRMHISESVASRLSNGDVISCLLAVSVKRPSRVIMVGTMGSVIKGDDLRHVVSILLWRKGTILSNNSKLCETVDMEHLKTETAVIIKSNPRIFHQSSLDNLDTNLGKALEDLHPCIIYHGDTIYSVPPVLINYLITEQMDILDDPAILAKMMTMANMVDLRSGSIDGGVRMSMRKSDFISDLQKSGTEGIRPEKILSDMPRLSNRIVYSRVLSKRL